MTILALDTSSQACSAALWRDGRVIARSLVCNGNTHSVNIMTLVERVLCDGGCGLADIDYYACVTGPGSFTGVRIGVGTARGLASGADKPCVAVNSLEALAALPFEGLICPILDARRAQVYCAAFRGQERALPDAAMDVEEFLRKARGLGGPWLFVGDGALAYADIIKKAMGDGARFAPEALMQVSAEAAAHVCAKNISAAVRHDMLEPYYLRAPQAERELGRKEAQNG